MSKVNVQLSGTLAQAAGTKNEEVEAATVRQLIEGLIAVHGKDFRGKLLDEAGTPRRFVNIYVDGKDIRFLDRLETKLAGGAKVSLIPAVAGG